MKYSAFTLFGIVQYFKITPGRGGRLLFYRLYLGSLKYINLKLRLCLKETHVLYIK